MKSGGSFIAFFDRPIAAGLALVTIMIWLSPLLALFRRRPLLQDNPD
jgi:TctA family transporter